MGLAPRSPDPFPNMSVPQKEDKTNLDKFMESVQFVKQTGKSMGVVHVMVITPIDLTWICAELAHPHRSGKVR